MKYFISFIFVVALTLNFFYPWRKYTNIKEDSVYKVYVDFSIPSGLYRFFIYEDSTLIKKSLCAHGKGLNSTIFTPEFSNEPGSNCSSLGKYEIGKEIRMTNGHKALRLYGLDSTNNNAYKRGILIHNGLPSCQIFPIYLPMSKISLGCFTIDSDTYETLKLIVNKNKNKVYLFATYGNISRLEYGSQGVAERKESLSSGLESHQVSRVYSE